MKVADTGCSQDEFGGLQQEKDTSQLKGSNFLDGQETVRTVIAARADDAEVPQYLWDRNISPNLEPRVIHALGFLREFALRWWKLHNLRDFLNWFCDTYRLGRAGGQLRQLRAPEWYLKLQRLLKANPEALKDWIAGRDCINRCCHATWWEWTEGSRPHFWRWSTEYRLTIRDGLPPWFKMPLPRWLIPQRLEPNLALRKAMKEKLGKVRRMGYLAPGEVKSLTSFFAVPKGDSDIRMVYDGTKSGLNDAMWAPWFWMPTVESHLRFVSTESFLGDIDVGDMFLNFVLHEDVKKVAGVDLSLYFPDELIEGRRVLWERWTRCGMGFRSSPYNTIQAFLFAEEQIRGNPWDLGNVLHCDAIRLNLPGSLRYEPSQPWVSKVRSQDGLTACDFIIYVDDIRSSGNSREDS